MAVRKMLVAAAAVGTIGFGLGFLTGPTDDVDDRPGESSTARIRRALASDDRLEQMRLFTPVLAAMESGDVGALVAVFEETFPFGGRGLLFELFVESWTRIDPEATRARIKSWPPDVRREAWPVWIGSRARSNPAAAIAALEEIPDASVRRNARPVLVDGWSSSGDPGLWQYLSEISNGRARRKFAAPRRRSATAAEKSPVSIRLGIMSVSADIRSIV